MSTTARLRRGDRWVAMHGLTWEDYQDLLRIRGDRPVPRIIYLDGSAWLVSPSEDHEVLTYRMRSIAEAVAKALRIRYRPTGATTFGRRQRRGGVEPDASYYIQHVAMVAGRKINPLVDPPPDLVIEAVHTHPVEPSLKTYRRLGVPEVWVYRKGAFRILHLQDGRYVDAARSLALPPVDAEEVGALVSLPGEEALLWHESVDAWIRDVLIPRREAP